MPDTKDVINHSDTKLQMENDSLYNLLTDYYLKS